MRLLCLCCFSAALLNVTQVEASPRTAKGFHPIQAIKAKWNARTFHPVQAIKAKWNARTFHPVQTIKVPFKAVGAKWNKERALLQIEKVVRAKPRLAVKFRERYGKLGGKKQFGTQGEWAMMTLGTAINIGGVMDPKRMLHYLIASTVVNLGTVAWHVINIKRKRRKAIISMIEDHTISNTDLKPFRKALGLAVNGRRLTPRPPAEPQPESPQPQE